MTYAKSKIKFNTFNTFNNVMQIGVAIDVGDRYNLIKVIGITL